MAKVTVVGPRTVGGIVPGKSGELDLPDANIAALVKAGHIRLAGGPVPADEATVVGDESPPEQVRPVKKAAPKSDAKDAD